MNVRSLLILAVFAVVLAVAAYYAVQESSIKPPQARLAVYDGLMEQVNSVSQITVSDAQTTITAIRQEDGSWGVQERDSYPADLELVRQAILGTARLELVEPRSSNPELYERLWLRDVSVGDSKAVRLTLNTQDGTILADFLRGKDDRFASGWRAGTLYLRKFGEEQTWLVSGRLSVPGRTLSWLDPDMPKLERDRIQMVEVVHPDGHSFRVERSDPEQEDFDIYPSSPPEMEINRYEVEGLEHGFAFLSLRDVDRVENVDFTDAIRNTAHTFDRLQMTISLIQRQEEWWIKVDADFEPTETGVEEDGGSEVSAEPVVGLPAAEPAPGVLPREDSAPGSELQPTGDNSAAADSNRASEVVTADTGASDGEVRAGSGQNDPLVVAKDEIELDISGLSGGENSEVPVEQVAHQAARDDTEIPSSDSLSLAVEPAVGNLSSGSPLDESAENLAAQNPLPEIVVPSSPASESSDVEPAPPDQVESADDSSGEGSGGAHELQSEAGDSEIALEAQHIRQRFGPWAYRIPENIALAFNKRFSDLFSN